MSFKGGGLLFKSLPPGQRSEQPSGLDRTTQTGWSAVRISGSALAESLRQTG